MLLAVILSQLHEKLKKEKIKLQKKEHRRIFVRVIILAVHPSFLCDFLSLFSSTFLPPTQLLESCSYSEFFWSIFFRIPTEYGEMGNADQNNFKYGRISRSGDVRVSDPYKDI